MALPLFPVTSPQALNCGSETFPNSIPSNYLKCLLSNTLILNSAKSVVNFKNHLGHMNSGVLSDSLHAYAQNSELAGNYCKPVGGKPWILQTLIRADRGGRRRQQCRTPDRGSGRQSGAAACNRPVRGIHGANKVEVWGLFNRAFPLTPLASCNSDLVIFLLADHITSLIPITSATY